MTTENTMSHYTTLSGLKSIIETSTLWATNVNFLNDQKEYLHAFDIFNKELEHFNNGIGDHSEYNNFFVSTIRKSIENLYKEGVDQHYTISFSAEKDQLSQWRAYGQVGIVFNRKKFTEEVESEHGFPIKISDCEYKEEKLSANIKNEIEKIFNQYISYSDAEKKNKVRLLLLDIHSDLYSIAAFYKHNGFKEEREIRLTYATNDEKETSFRRVFKTLCQQLQFNVSIQSSGKMNRQLRQRQIPILHGMRPSL